MEVFNLENIIQAQIVSRPSKHIKSPYVSDIIISESGESTLAHTPSLGCAGHVEAGSIVYVIPLQSKTSKCKYSIELALYEEKDKNKKIIIGVNPKLSENIARNILQNNLLNNILTANVKSQVTISNSRFDFIGMLKDSNKPYICEIKNVSIADYIDISNKERKKLKINFNDYLFEDKIALFPDCQRKLQSKPISERALKHIEELKNIKLKDNSVSCILLFVIQREDISRFAVSCLDPIYRKTVQDGWQNGVDIRAINVKWIYDSSTNTAVATLINNMVPIMLYDDCNYHQIQL
jgi:DNA-binding sugar fermentation-stimulating protein